DLGPGQTVALQAAVTAPSQGGAFSLRFDLVQEGIGWFSSRAVIPLSISVNVAGPVVPSYGATYQPGVTSLGVSRGMAAAPFPGTNRTTFTWSPAGANPVNLSYHWIDSAGTMITWEGLRTKLPVELAPGASAALQAQVAFPVAQGKYTLRWDM